MARSDAWLIRTARIVWTVELAMIALDLAVNLPSFEGGLLDLLSDTLFLFLGFSFSLVGLIVLSRQPRNRLAWFLLLGTGAAIAVPALSDAYAVQGLVNAPGSLPGADIVVAINQGSWVWAIGSIGIFVVLLFPDGRVPTPRWRWLVWAGASTMVVISVTISLLPGKFQEGVGKGMVNPLGLESLEVPVTVIFLCGIALLPMLMVAAAVALVLRFRRSHGTERLQLKWFSAAGALVAVSYLTAMAGQFLKPTPFDGPDPGWLLVLQQVASLSFAALPIAIGTAILRHRLYDVDVVIKRTLVYGSLTVTLAAIYLLLVLTLRSLAGPITGDSDLAVAASTLAVAALFRPLRRRIQQVVDRRFYRRAYDAADTVASFVGRLRQEVDLESVSSDLRVVVAETMQPSHLSLWLRRGR